MEARELEPAASAVPLIFCRRVNENSPSNHGTLTPKAPMSKPFHFSTTDTVQVGKLTGLAAVGFVAAYLLSYLWNQHTAEVLSAEQLAVLATACTFVLGALFQWLSNSEQK